MKLPDDSGVEILTADKSEEEIILYISDRVWLSAPPEKVSCPGVAGYSRWERISESFVLRYKYILTIQNAVFEGVS